MNQVDSLTANLRAGDVSALRRAGATNIDLPRTDIELRVHGLNLPPGCRVVQVACSEHVDSLCGELLETDGGSPAESNLRAAEHDGVDGEADGGLGALTSDERGLGAKGVAAERDASEPVDAVRGIGEVAGQEGVGGSVGVGAKKGAIAVRKVGSGGIGQAKSRWGCG